MYEVKNRIIDDIEIVAFRTFGRNGLAIIRENGLDADDLGKDHIDDALFAHLAPSLTIVMVLADHEFFGFVQYSVVKGSGFFAAHVDRVCISFAALYNCHYAVVDYCAKISFDIVAHETHTRLLTLPDIADLDIELICDAMQAKDTP